jgi:D-serine deaminase-like pyridoxal phosphate-dependent protein
MGLYSTTGAAAIATALGGPSAAGSTRVEVLVEIDSGGRRSGVAPLAAGRLAAAAADLGLDVIGVFTHGGHGYAGRDIRAAAADDEVHALETAAVSLAQAGIEPRVISAGSTPTAVASARGVVTEERPGTYVLGDRQQVALGSIERDAVAAFIAGTVVSVDADGGRFVVDAGAKILAKDVADYVAGHGSVVPLAGSGALEAAGVEAVVSRIYDYHGVVQLPDGSAMPSVGEVVAVVPNHICPVVNLVDHLVIVQAGRIIGHWPVNARGRNG